MEECGDPANESRWVGTGPTRCHRATAIAMHQAKYFSQFSEKSPPRYPQALQWGLKTRE